MSRYDYEQSIKLSVAPFYALIMAAMRKADTDNLELLKEAFPGVWKELKARYDAPGGFLSEAEYRQEYEGEWSKE